MTKQAFVVATIFFGLAAEPCCAYQVWMGTHLMESSVATNLDDWGMTASWLDGVNINRAPDDTNPASNSEWQTVLGQFANVSNTMTEIARSEVSKNPLTVNEAAFTAIGVELQQKFQEASNFNHAIDHLMFYDNATSYQGTQYNYNWTEVEAQHIRSWLDTNGHQDVSLIWNARNNSQANRDWSASALIDHVMIEASADSLLNNTNNQITLLNWLWTNPATANKNVILQIPRSNNAMTQYASTRQVAVTLGNEIGYENGLQSERLVFLPVTYNDNYAYLPETTSNDASYNDSLTSLALSLIEQRPYFEGRMGELPADFAASTERFELPASIASATDGSLRRHKGNNAVDGANLGFVVNSGSLDVGQTGAAPYDRAAVIPFQLPDFGDVDNPFLWTYFEGFLTKTATQDGLAADLYGLDRRSTAEILDSDYYGLTNSADPNATLLQDNFLTADMDVNASFYSNSGGNKNLLSFLNEQYAGGEGAGDYVFLRVSSNANNTQNWAFASGDSGDESLRPQLRYLSANVEVIPGSLIASWETWSEVSTDTWDATQSSGVTAQAVGSVEAGGVWFNLSNATVANGASSDGRYGAVGPTGADPSVASATDGVSLSNGYDGFMDFTLNDTSGAGTILTGFHFDLGAFRANAATDWELAVLAGGDLTAGALATGTATVGASPMQDDESIDLRGLTDNILDANGTVTFRLSFTGGVDASSGHHLFLDNVGVTGVSLGLAGDYNRDGVVDAADYTVWRDHLGAPAGTLPNDPYSGAIGADQYNTWRDHFGQSTSSAATVQNAAVPEPDSLAVLVLMAFGKLVVKRTSVATDD
ncbi:hypothetical protein Pla175_23000 [Pirellulimonas nuda]|uniref:Uncharacterized protein n=1 Tax=Pirellulimonas nuda TaxID=2528009 RepID=A0A518DBU9_9BACT|nr:hypothetical protein [Pirellulimonas nuda]QDU88916.1 hypothetical protein Pla175_23000 [Pirellulimonas nuda]